MSYEVEDGLRTQRLERHCKFKKQIKQNPLTYGLIINFVLFLYYIFYKLIFSNCLINFEKCYIDNEIKALKTPNTIILTDFIVLIHACNMHGALFFLEIIVHKLGKKWKICVLAISTLILSENILFYIYKNVKTILLEGVYYQKNIPVILVIFIIASVKNPTILFIAPQIFFSLFLIFNFFNDSLLKQLKTHDCLSDILSIVGFDLKNILEEFFEKYKFDPENLFSAYSTSNSFSTIICRNLKKVEIINLDPDCLMKNPELTKFILYHEYGHLHHKSLDIILILNILQNLIISSYVFLNIKFNVKDNNLWYKNILKIIAKAYLINKIFSLLLNSVVNYHEYLADDFSFEVSRNINEITSFVNDLYDKYKQDQEELIFFPPYYPLSTHPSLYHRFLRQYKKLNSKIL